MTVYKLQTEKRISWSGSTDGYYSWINVYYFNAVTFDEYTEALDIIIPADIDMHLNSVDQGVYRVTDLTSGLVVEQDLIYSAHNTHLPGEPVDLTSVLRAYAYCDDGRLYYKRYRVPLRAVDCDSPRTLSATGLASYTVRVRRPRAGGFLCNRYGSPVGPIVLSPLIHQWQWRDGTKRRSRRVLR